MSKVLFNRGRIPLFGLSTLKFNKVFLESKLFNEFSKVFFNINSQVPGYYYEHQLRPVQLKKGHTIAIEKLLVNL